MWKQGLALCICLQSALLWGAGWMEEFSEDPLRNGWRVSGNTNLFVWDNLAGVLRVTWDSRETNSFFYRPLGTILTLQDDFQFSFRLRMSEIRIGVDPEKPYTFELALGLIHSREVNRANLFRGSGRNLTFGPRNLVEFDYFPDSGFGATWAPTVVSSNNVLVFSGNHPLELTTGDDYVITMSYTAAERMLRTEATRNGEAFGLPPAMQLRGLSLAGLPDYRLDGFSITSYSDAGQSPPEFAGSILARGEVDRVVVEVPPAPIQALRGGFENGQWHVRLNGQSNWVYTLERSINWDQWREIDEANASTNGPLSLWDQAVTSSGASIYRVKANRP